MIPLRDFGYWKSLVYKGILFFTEWKILGETWFAIVVHEVFCAQRWERLGVMELQESIMIPSSDFELEQSFDTVLVITYQHYENLCYLSMTVE